MPKHHWIRALFARPAAPAVRVPRPARQLDVERLEDRTVPATFTVTDTTDNASDTGSLRYAVNQAVADGDDDTIQFSLLQGAQTITLTNGQLNLTKASGSITIDGTGDMLSISGGGASRVFYNGSGSTAALDGLTITNGQANSDSGGGVYNHGVLSMTGCTVRGSSAAYGGGVYNHGALSMTDCTVSGNTTTSSGGVYSRGTLSMTGCTVANNSAAWGGGVYNLSGTATLTDCTISGNTASRSGGGVYNNVSGVLSMTGCTVTDNNAKFVGGGLYNGSATATLTDCTISGNTVLHQGGGVYNYSAGVLSMTGCTISGNTAAEGGGVYCDSGTTTLTGCTISGNSALAGGGVFISRGTATLTDTIVAGNTLTHSATACDIGEVSGSLSASSSNNLIGTGGSGGLANGTNGNLVGVSVAAAGLAPLGNYGGPTQTMALLPGSLAIDAGSGGPATDQRGLARVGATDIGAVESQGYTLTAADVSTPQTTSAGTAFANALAVTVTAKNSADPVNGGAVRFTAPSTGASAALSASTATISNGKASVTATANSTVGGYTVTALDAEAGAVTFDLTNELQPTFTGLSSGTITYGTTSDTFTGTLAAGSTGATGSVTVTISGNGITALTRTGELGTGGTFTVTFSTATLPASTTAYTVTYSYAGQGDFLAATDSSTTLTVGRESITVKANTGQFKTYGNVTPALTYTITSGTLYNDAALTGALGRTAGENVGSYAINQGSLAVSDTTDYTLTLTPGTTFAITPRAITVTANPGQGKIYGNAAPTLTYTVGGNGLAFSDTLSGSLSRAAGENVGHYVITQGSLNASSNYTLTFTPGTTFAITPRAITVTANSNQSKVYGNADPTLTYTVGGSGLAFADTLSGALSRAAGENVGSYTITQGTLSASSNYTLTFIPGTTFAITARALTVTASTNQSKVYGNADPTLTYTIGGGGLAFADTLSGALSRAAGENVGSYAINQGTLSASANYTLSYVGANFAVTARALTVTASANQSKVYGNADPALSYVIGGAGLAFADTLSGALSRAAGEDVGTYAISQGTLTAGGNYTLTFVGADFGITARALTITAGSGQSKTFGTADPTLAYSVTSGGLAFSDTFTGALGRTTGENVGTYAVTQGTLSVTDASDYAITYVGADFTIDAATITVTADANQSKVYGDADPTLTYQITSGALVSGSPLTGALSQAAGESVGSYAVTQGTLTGGSNYVLTFVGTNFTVTARPITVTADPNQSEVYGGAEPVLTYRITAGNLVHGDALSGALAHTGTTPGVYAVTQGTLTAGGNYALTFVGAAFVIDAPPAVASSPPIPAASPVVAVTNVDGIVSLFRDDQLVWAVDPAQFGFAGPTATATGTAVDGTMYVALAGQFGSSTVVAVISSAGPVMALAALPANWGVGGLAVADFGSGPAVVYSAAGVSMAGVFDMASGALESAFQPYAGTSVGAAVAVSGGQLVFAPLFPVQLLRTFAVDGTFEGQFLAYPGAVPLAAVAVAGDGTNIVLAVTADGNDFVLVFNADGTYAGTPLALPAAPDAARPLALTVESTAAGGPAAFVLTDGATIAGIDAAALEPEFGLTHPGA